MRALVRAARERPRLEDEWDAASWAGAETLELAHFRPEGSAHRPRTRARLLHTGDGIAGIFRVEDRYVRSRHRRFGDPVCEDSCVEIFLEPRPAGGYLNFEMNAGGALLASHVTDPRRVGGELMAAKRLRPDDGRLVQLRSSLPSRVEPEIAKTVDWQLAFFIPLATRRALPGPARAARRTALARQPLQVRRQDLAPALGLVVPARRAQLPPAPLLRHARVRGRADA